MPTKVIIPYEEKERHIRQLKGALIRQRQKDGWKVKDGLSIDKFKEIQGPVWDIPDENMDKYIEELESKGLLIRDEFNNMFGSKKLENEYMQKALKKWDIA